MKKQIQTKKSEIQLIDLIALLHSNLKAEEGIYKCTCKICGKPIEFSKENIQCSNSGCAVNLHFVAGDYHIQDYLSWLIKVVSKYNLPVNTNQAIQLLGLEDY